LRRSSYYIRILWNSHTRIPKYSKERCILTYTIGFLATLKSLQVFIASFIMHVSFLKIVTWDKLFLLLHVTQRSLSFHWSPKKEGETAKRLLRSKYMYTNPCLSVYAHIYTLEFLACYSYTIAKAFDTTMHHNTNTHTCIYVCISKTNS